MGTTLTGTTPQDTYDSLIKVTDNGPIGATAKLLSDGLGNDSSLALSTTFTSVRSGNQLRLYRTDNATYGSIEYLTGAGGFKFDDVNSDGYRFNQGADTRLAITSTGNVGIGTSSPPADNQLAVLGNFQSGFYRNVTSGDRGYRLNLGANTASGTLTNAATMVGILEDGDASGYLVLQTRSAGTVATRLRVDADGLKFGSDTAAANALDDYEEGTWTMGVSFGGASVGVTYSANSGTYTKIGRQVTVNGYVALTSKGSSTGAARITGLPFTIPNTGSNYSVPSLLLETITFSNQYTGLGQVAFTNIELYEFTVLGVGSPITDADFANNSGIYLSFTYFV